MIPAIDEFVRPFRGPAGRGLAARIVWGGLLAMHGPAVVSASGAMLSEPTVLGALRLVGLLATIAFFAFKACGGRVLPTRTRPWIATAAFLALTGIAHAGLLPGNDGEALAESAPAALVLAGGVAVAAQRRRIIHGVDLLTDFVRRWLGAFGSDAARLVIACSGLMEPVPALALAQHQRCGPAPTRGPPVHRTI